MKITLFINSLYGGGAERVACNLANYLFRRGHDVEILAMSETERTYELDTGIGIKYLLHLNERKSKKWNTVIRMPRFWSYLLLKHRDVYVVMLPTTTIMLLMFKWMTRSRVIAAERVDPSVYPEDLAADLRKNARKADGYVFQTEEAMAWYGNSVQTCCPIVIPNAINEAFIRPRYTGVKRRAIASAGRLNHQKNYPLLLRAFSRIANEYPDISLIIYGEGEDRQIIEEFSESLGINKRVSMPGNIQNIAEEMEKNMLFVLASDYEGMPNALMEAMSLGLPCISTDCPCGGPRFLIKDGINGLLVPVNNADAMAEAIKRVLSDDSFAASLAEEARKISESLSASKIYGQWEKYIMDIVAK